ncbi:hypothetical protein CMUS01_12746 [Colletotrichum musicola]|uniref:Uncharacterized protein n=1 Tax=Colletotrichum musicola TaxID=2175873 RepID=A0A8H6JJR5_9PEZI|nr:hypothetical protein CMUS01_12746 [Colletotrichum musicola]
MEIQPARLTKAAKLKLRPYYNLIDQITATIAHLSFSVWEKDCMCGENDYWDMILIACLATISAKMKILAFNLRKNIEGCLERNETFESPESKHNEGPSSEASEVPLDDNSQDEDRYIKEFTGVTSWLVKCFTSVLTGLGAQKSWKIPSNDVDVAAVVYPAGVKGTSTLLFQDRRRSMSGTADTLPMHFCMTALKLVKDLDNKLPQETELPTLSSTPREDAAGSGDKTEETNCFFYIEGHVNRYNLVSDLHGKPLREYSKIWQYIIITITLSISQPDIREAFQNTLRPISALSAFGIPNLLPDDPFYAFLGLRLTPKSPSAPSKTSQFRSTETPFSSLAKQKREILNHIILDPSIRVDFKMPLGILFNRGQNKRKFLQDQHRK